MAKNKQPSGGRPPFEPTAEQRAEVSALVAFGVPQKEIAPYIGVALETFRKHFKEELETGKTRFIRKLGMRAYNLAMQESDLNVAANMTKFFLARQAGWTEKQQVEHSGPEGGPIQTSGVLAVPGVASMADWAKITGSGAAPSVVDDEAGASP